MIIKKECHRRYKLTHESISRSKIIVEPFFGTSMKLYIYFYTPSHIYPSFCVDDAITTISHNIFYILLLPPYIVSSITVNQISFFPLRFTVIEPNSKRRKPNASLNLLFSSSLSASKTVKRLGSPHLPKEIRIESEGV